jgi:hypothetical protein
MNRVAANTGAEDSVTLNVHEPGLLRFGRSLCT